MEYTVFIARLVERETSPVDPTEPFAFNLPFPRESPDVGIPNECYIVGSIVRQKEY